MIIIIMASCNNIKIDIKLGSIYPNESLNTEFKKFTVDRKSDLIIENKSDLNTFFKSGIMTPKFSNIILDILLGNIYNRVPKYVSCFFNMEDLFSHSESFFFIGIDDFGIINGIPFNFKNISKDELCSRVQNTIRQTIYTNMEENVEKYLVSHNDIISCIDAYVIEFEYNKNNFLKNISSSNLEEIEDLKNDIKKLEKKILGEKQNKMDINLLVDSLAINEFKNNVQINKKMLKYITSTNDFNIIYDENNKSHVDYLNSIMVGFDTNNYDHDYKDKIKILKHIDINDRGNFAENLIFTLSTFIHENVKRLIERLRNNTLKTFEDVKNKLKNTNNCLNKKKERLDKLYYSFDTHFNILINHNSYIMIKIKFDNQKYKNLLKQNANYINRDSHLLSYNIYETDDKGVTIIRKVIAQRKLKYIQNKLDPECHVK
jgi:hypothetical protein